MNKLLQLLILLLTWNFCFSQVKINPEVEFGLSIPTGESVSRAHNQGMTGAIGFSFNVWKGLCVTPSFQYRIFINQLDEDVTESLRISSFSGSVGYYVLDKETVKIKPEFGIGTASFRNLFKVTYPDGESDTEEMMIGNDVFYEVGISFFYKKVYFNLSHQWFDAVPTFDPIIQEAVTENPSLYQLDYIVDKRLDMNNYSFTIGYKFL